MRVGPKIKVGIIGCGEHSSENLIPSLWSTQLADVIATCDPDETVAARVAARFPAATSYGDFHRLLEESGVDAVVAAAPPEIHLQVANLALSRGIHVFLEKPPTVGTQDIVALAEIAHNKRLVTMVGHNLRYSSASLAMKSIVLAPGFGTPQAVEVRYYASKPRGDRWGLGSPIRSFLLSHVNHAIDLIVFQVGQPLAVEAGANIHPNGAITLAARFDFEHGGVGTLFASTNCPHFSVQASVFSSDNAYVAMDSLYELSSFGLAGDPKRLGHSWVERQLDSGYQHSGYQTELEVFLKAIGGDVQAQPSFSDEVSVYHLIDEIERQIASKKQKNETSSRPK